MFVEIIGESNSGKTHMALTFPDPFVFDLTQNKETMVNLSKQFSNDWRDRYFPVQRSPENPYEHPDLNGVREKLDEVLDEYDTIIFETSKDLRTVAGEEWKKEHDAKKVYPQTEWGDIKRNKINPIVARVNDKCHMVITSYMGPKYDKDGNKTGQRERKGMKRTDFMCDLRFYIELSEDKRDVSIVKTRFEDPVDSKDTIKDNDYEYVEKIVPEFWLQPDARSKMLENLR